MFNAPKLTNAGKALYYDNMAGTQIVFTTIQLGSGNISGPIAPMTALVTPVVTINAEAKSVSGQYAEISGHFSNAQLADGFYFREIGVFAADPDYPNDRGKDILYCYQNAYDTADFIPVASVETVEKNITIPVIIGDAAAVSCTLSRSLILASMEDLDNHNKNQNAHEDLRKALEKKQEKITVSGLLKGDGKGGISAQQFDTKPTKDSGNLLTSGAVATAMDAAAALTSAAEYSAAMTYAVGAYCTKDGKLYRCTVAIPQAEAWNADHWTETTIGAELVAIYTTLANKAPATHADQHAKGGADPITPESIGAAPGGYGSGDYGKMLTADDDLNTLTVGGHYLFFGNSIPQNAPTGLIDWTAYVIENLPYNELVTAQILHIIVPDLTYGYGKYSNCSLRRTRYGDTYTPWAWINPPMELGVEYMTTEHHIGKPVYCKLVDLGEGTNGKTVNVGTTEMVHVECRATYSRWSLPMPELPFGSTDRSLEHTNAQAFYSNANTVTIIKGSTCPAFTATAKVYYIKSTD